MADHAKLLLRLLYQPASAMGAILDRGSLLFASAAVLAASLWLKIDAPWLPFSFYAPLLVLAAVYVPGALLLSSLLARLGGAGVVFQRDYSPLLTSTAMALAAIEVPLAVAAWAVPPLVLLCLGGLALLYFAVLMFFAVRTIFGTGNWTAAGVVSLSWVPLVPRLSFGRRSDSCWGGSLRPSSCSMPGTISAASSATWARGCAAARIFAACSKPPP